MNKAIFLDRDGTINVDKGYVYKYEDFEYTEGAVEALKLFKENGYLLIIVTNQSGIARGYYSEEQFLTLHDKINDNLKEQGIVIDDVYYCPHLEGCKCRKPQTYLFRKAAIDYDIDWEQSYAIGDRMRDLQICQEENVKGFLLLGTGEKLTDGVIGVSTLLEAANIICGSINNNDNEFV